jgi:hypothetical protein
MTDTDKPQRLIPSQEALAIVRQALRHAIVSNSVIPMSDDAIERIIDSDLACDHPTAIKLLNYMFEIAEAQVRRNKVVDEVMKHVMPVVRQAIANLPEKE